MPTMPPEDPNDPYVSRAPDFPSASHYRMADPSLLLWYNFDPDRDHWKQHLFMVICSTTDFNDPDNEEGMITIYEKAQGKPVKSLKINKHWKTVWPYYPSTIFSADPSGEASSIYGCLFVTEQFFKDAIIRRGPVAYDVKWPATLGLRLLELAKADPTFIKTLIRWSRLGLLTKDELDSWRASRIGPVPLRRALKQPLGRASAAAGRKGARR